MSKISTKAYCVKCLRDSGYNIDRLDSIEYTEEDHRKWSILIDNGVASILCTCMKDNTLRMYDGSRFFDTYQKLKIDNPDILITFLHESGIMNKHYLYTKRIEVEVL